MARWERPFSGLPPTHSDLFRFLQQEQLLSGCTTQHIGQNFEGDRPRKGLVKWLERVEWLESYQELDENEASWNMVRVKYEIVACWAGIPVFKCRSDTPARPPEAPPPPWMGVWWPSRSRMLYCPSQLWARKAKQAKFQNLNLDFVQPSRGMTLDVQGYSKGSETSCVARQGKDTLVLGLLQSLFYRDVNPCS